MFAARMAGRPYSAGGIRSTVAATRAATDEQLAANLARLATEMLAQGTTTFECKSGYGLTVADEARSVALAAQVTPEVTYLGAQRGRARVPRRPRTATSTSSAGCDADRVRAARPLGRRVLRAGRVRRGRGPGRARGRRGGPACSRGSTPASSAPDPASRSQSRRGRPRPTTCTFVTDADVAALAASGTVATLPARRGVLHPPAVPAGPPVAGQRGHGRAGPRTATQAPASPRACRCAWRSPCGRCG